MDRDPAALYRVLEPGEVLGRRALYLEEKRAVDLLDVDALILNGVDAAGDLDQLSGSGLRVRQRVSFNKLFHAARISSLSAPRRTIFGASSGRRSIHPAGDPKS